MTTIWDKLTEEHKREFFKNDFTITGKTISTAAKGNDQLRTGNYIYIIAEQTSKKVKFVDYL